MAIKNTNPLKTLGPQAARFVALLHERRRLIFRLDEVVQITGLKNTSARSFIRKLVNRGVATRLVPGLYILVPFEMGRQREYAGNPYVVARELMQGKPYYLSHASALEIHRATTQPQLVVFVTSPRRMRNITILGTEFQFVRCNKKHFFGIFEHWIDKEEKIVVSNLERTILDGLKQPGYCGGFTEVAKAFWMRRQDIKLPALIDYALRLQIGAVIRRLGYLLEMCYIDAPDQIQRLRKRLTAAYMLLDPGLPREGKFQSRWRLRLNIDPDEIHSLAAH